MINFYTCRDLVKTEEFWLKLGLTIYMRQPNTIIFDSKEGMVGFIESKEHVVPKYSCISMVVKSKEEVDMKYQQLQEYALDVPKVHATAPVYSFFLEDPNGYKVEFQQFI